MTENRTLRRWMPRMLTATAAGLVPWMVLLCRTLPSAAVARHWSVAWVGLDVLLAAGCGGTALLDRRDDARTGLAAAATATVALLDAWFDTATAQPGVPFVQALICAAGELTLAGGCAYLALEHAARPRRLSR